MKEISDYPLHIWHNIITFAYDRDRCEYQIKLVK